MRKVRISRGAVSRALYIQLGTKYDGWQEILPGTSLRQYAGQLAQAQWHSPRYSATIIEKPEK